MIPRYSRDKISAIWSDETKFQIWLDIELHACDAMAKENLIPKDAVKRIRERAAFLVSEVHENEAIVKHDVIAFLTSVARHVGDEARFIHQGMTSSDVLDTAFAVQLVRATDILLQDIAELLDVLQKRAFEFKGVECIGRSHGVHAEPTTFGLKLAVAFAEFKRNQERLKAARKEIATCAISGAVGTYAYVVPEVERYVAEKLGLQPEPISTQVIPRDRHAAYFATLGVIASSVERLAVEIRHLQRTEVREVEEAFGSGQKGSSAMPHKRNPIQTENLTGLARMVRSYVTPALENVALWHERDISHSSVERMIGPDATVTLDFALNRLTGVIREMRVFPNNMRANLNLLNGLNFSQEVLLALTERGLSRERAYAIVQRHAMAVWEERSALQDEEGPKERRPKLLDKLVADSNVTSVLTLQELEKCFNMDRHKRHETSIFVRVFGRKAVEEYERRTSPRAKGGGAGVEPSLSIAAAAYGID